MKKYYIIFAFLLAGFYSLASTRLFVPVLVAPADAAVGQMPDVLLDWNPVSGTIGLHYEIQVDTSAGFMNPVLLQTEVTSIRNSELLFDTKYFWRVRAVDNDGASEWSVIRSFNVVVTVSLYKPINNALKQMPQLEISWSPKTNPNKAESFTGVSFLDYQLDTLSTFDSPLSTTTTISGTLAKINLTKLYFGQKYYWRMRARNNNDTTVWSDSRFFTTINELTLKTPDNNVVNLNPIVAFTWTAITGVDKYILLISDNPDFNLPLTKETNKVTISSDTLQFGMTYYWKVTALHSLDGVTSPVRMFSTLNTVVLSAPSNNQTGVELTPNFKWTAIKGSDHYELWLSGSPAFTGAKKYTILNSNPATGPQTYRLPINILDSAGVYFWKVRAIISGDTTMWSDSWSFTSAATGIADNLVPKNGLAVYPNPAKDQVSLAVQSSGSVTLKFNITDLLGKSLISTNMQFSNGRSVSDVDVSSLPNGIYFVKLQKDSGVLMTKLIIYK